MAGWATGGAGWRGSCHSCRILPGCRREPAPINVPRLPEAKQDGTRGRRSAREWIWRGYLHRAVRRVLCGERWVLRAPGAAAPIADHQRSPLALPPWNRPSPHPTEGAKQQPCARRCWCCCLQARRSARRKGGAQGRCRQRNLVRGALFAPRRAFQSGCLEGRRGAAIRRWRPSRAREHRTPAAGGAGARAPPPPLLCCRCRYLFHPLPAPMSPPLFLRPAATTTLHLLAGPSSLAPRPAAPQASVRPCGEGKQWGWEQGSAASCCTAPGPLPPPPNCGCPALLPAPCSRAGLHLECLAVWREHAPLPAHLPGAPPARAAPPAAAPHPAGALHLRQLRGTLPPEATCRALRSACW